MKLTQCCYEESHLVSWLRFKHSTRHKYHTNYPIIWTVGCSRQCWRSHTSRNLGTKCKQWYLHSDTWIFINWIWIATRFRDCQLWGTRSGDSAILAPKCCDQENQENPHPRLWNKGPHQFSSAAMCFMPKMVSHQTTPVWFVKNEYVMVKIYVYRSLLPSDCVIGWDAKMTSHPNSNASFINIWDRLIWRWSPNLTRSSKLAAAPNCWMGVYLTPYFANAFTFYDQAYDGNAHMDTLDRVMTGN